MLREEVPTTVSKPVFSWFAKDKIKALNIDCALEAGLFAIDSIGANRAIAFEEEVIKIEKIIQKFKFRTPKLKRK